MGSIKTNRSLNGSQGLLSQVQTIAGEIENSPISPRRYQNLSRRLDTTFEALHHLETNKTANLFAKTQTAYLKEQCVHLYKKLEDGLVDREISQIQLESHSLEQGDLSPKAVKKLESHIDTLMQNHAPSVEQHRVLAGAKSVLQRAKASLAGEETPSHFGWLAQQRDVYLSEGYELLPGEIEELYDIAKAVHDHDLRTAKMRYQTLPQDHKNLFQKHAHFLSSEPFVDLLGTIQALIATANDLVENGELYPSSQQIEEFFLGLAQVNEEERTEGKILPFNPPSSWGG